MLLRRSELLMDKETLPSAYRQLKYILNTAKATGWLTAIPLNSIEKCEAIFKKTMYNSDTQDNHILGGRNASTGHISFCRLDNTETGGKGYFTMLYYSGSSSYLTGNNPYSLNTLYKMESYISSKSMCYCKLNGETKISKSLTSTTLSTTSNPALLWNWQSNNDGTQGSATLGELYYMRLTNNTTHEYSAILYPCQRRSDGNIGWYNFVNETYYPLSYGSVTAGQIISKRKIIF